MTSMQPGDNGELTHRCPGLFVVVGPPLRRGAKHGRCTPVEIFSWELRYFPPPVPQPFFLLGGVTSRSGAASLSFSKPL